MPAFPDDVRLRGDGFAVRRLRATDVDGFHELLNDPDVRLWSSPHEVSPAAARSQIENAAAAWSQGSSALLAIAAPDGTVLGAIGLTPSGPHRASLAYDLVPSARGRGIATTAVRLVSAWAFEHCPELVRLEIWAACGNERSERVAERAGFVREGVFRSRLPFGDEFRDVTVFSRLRGEAPAP